MVYGIQPVSVFSYVLPSPRHPINSQYTMHNQILATVDTARNLGVDLSSNVNFIITSSGNKTFF